MTPAVGGYETEDSKIFVFEIWMIFDADWHESILNIMKFVSLWHWPQGH